MEALKTAERPSRTGDRAEVAGGGEREVPGDLRKVPYDNYGLPYNSPYNPPANQRIVDMKKRKGARTSWLSSSSSRVRMSLAPPAQAVAGRYWLRPEF
jgi:hypothetical protein